MFIFNLASKEPIPVKIGDTVYQLPRFQRRDWLAWQKDIDEERRKAALEKMDDQQAAQFQMLYPLEPITRMELRKRVDTLEGTGRVFTTCAKRGGVPDEDIKRIVVDGECDEGYLEAVVLMLISIADPSDVAKKLSLSPEEKQAQQEAQGEEGEDPNDPLPGSPVD